MTKVEPWSRTIRRRRLNWLGHLIRLSPETPARMSLYEALRTTKRKIGKAKTTWLKVIEKDLNGNVKLDVFKDPAEITIMKLINVTRDREVWRTIVKNTMALKS